MNLKEKIQFYLKNSKNKKLYASITKEDFWLEIKSKYTYEVEKDKNDAKFLSTKNNDYIHRLLILSK
jgi:ribosomal protein L9